MSGKFVKCKTCSNEIASSAKSCPKCGARNKKPIYTKWWAWTIAIIVIIIIVAGSEESDDSTGTSTETSTKTTAKKSKTTATPTTFSIGQPITTKDLEFIVEKVGTAKFVGDFYNNSSPAEGAIYVTLSVSYKNISDKPKGMFSKPSFNLIDPKGIKYSTDYEAQMTYCDSDSKILSKLNPGIKVRDCDVYEVSKELYGNGEGWKILINSDRGYLVKIVEDVSEEWDEREPPEGIYE